MSRELGELHKRELSHELGVLDIQRQVHQLYAEKIKELEAVEEARLIIEKQLKETQKSLLLVEGKTDKSIIEIAWSKLRGGEIPFCVRVADPAADGSTGGTGMLAKTIEGVHPDDSRCCAALFDQDAEGIKGFDGLSKNFSQIKGLPLVKKHRNGVSFALLLPAPDFRKPYVNAKNHMIEFMFSDDILLKKVEEIGLTFKKPVTNLSINGISLEDSQQYLLPGAISDFSAFRKIHSGKDHFAEKIVPTLDKSDFLEFEKLFSVLESLENFV